MCDIEVSTIVNDILQSCTYILSRENRNGVYIVDCGNAEPIIEFVENNNKIIEGIILTHSHYDHIYGLNALLEKAPNLVVIAGRQTFDGLEDVDVNMSYLYIDDDFLVRLNDNQRIIVEDGSVHDILGSNLECMATPGHTPDCMSFIIGESIFTGDSYNPASPVFTKWRNSDVQLALTNENKIREIINRRGLKVFPGHKMDEI